MRSNFFDLQLYIHAAVSEKYSHNITQTINSSHSHMVINEHLLLRHEGKYQIMKKFKCSKLKLGYESNA
jgi:hypothetical protein